MTHPAPEQRPNLPPTPPRWSMIVAGFAGAILAGALMGVLVTGAVNLIGRNAPTAEPDATATVAPTPAPPQASGPPSPARTGTATASPARTDTPPSDPAASPSATPMALLPAGCFTDGFLKPRPDEQLEPIVAPELRDRMPLPHPLFSTAQAFVGSSLSDDWGRAFVDAFASCTGVGPDAIRFGAVTGGLRHGVMPHAIQVDGRTGPELADILVDRYLWPQQRDEMESGSHDGWTYRYVAWTIAIAASADTVYWFWWLPCCYEEGDSDEGVRSSFEAVIHDYLERINDEPAG